MTTYTKTWKILSSTALILGLAACGSQKATTTTPANGSNGSTSAPIDNQPATWNQVSYEGKPSEGMNAGAVVLQIDKEKEALVMILPIPAVLPVLGEATFPELEGTELTTITQPDGTIAVAIIVPLRYLIRGADLSGHPAKLPNGDALPGLPSGELPKLSIGFKGNKNYKVHLYIGASVAAAFVEVPGINLPIPLNLTFPVTNKEKTKRIGTIGYIRSKSTYAGGIYLAAQLPPELGKILDEILPR